MKDLLKKARERVWLEGDPEKDHSTGLVVFGILEIVLGILAFSTAMFLLVLVSAAGLGGMKPAHFWMVMGLLFYLTGWFIVVGMGSIKAQRWARILVLVGSWVTIFFGTLVLALILYILPGAYNLLADSGFLSPSAAMAILYSSIALLFVLQLVFPLLAIVFHGLRGVEATCERRNPSPCWTDRYPFPLLSMGFVSAMGCLSIFLGATTNHVVFLFGHVLSGWSGAGIVLLISAVCGYVGWGAFMRKIHAWWIAYALILLVCSSMMLTFAGQDMGVLYACMGYSPEQIAHLDQLQLLSPAMLTFVTCVWGIMACIYLVWVRDCFLPERHQPVVKSYAQRKAEESASRPPVPIRPRMRLD